MDEIQRVSGEDGIVVDPSHFKLGDTAHETMTNEAKPIRDKKSKQNRQLKTIGLFV